MRLYQDPFYTTADICRSLHLSRATFYRYEAELGWPSFRVGVANASNLPLHKARKNFRLSTEQYDLEVLRAVGARMQARLKLVPLNLDRLDPEKAVRERRVDFALGSLTWTEQRAREFHFSLPYQFHDAPHGFLIEMKKPKCSLRNGRDRLGVPLGTVHSSFAHKNLGHTFEVVDLPSAKAAFAALKLGAVEHALMHEHWFEILGLDKSNYVLAHKPFLYNSFTGMIFHQKASQALEEVNGALSEMRETGAFGRLAYQYPQ